MTKQLRELEENGFIVREVFPEVPPRVEYSLSEKGRDFLPILEMMEKFGEKHGEIQEINNIKNNNSTNIRRPFREHLTLITSDSSNSL